MGDDGQGQGLTMYNSIDYGASEVHTQYNIVSLNLKHTANYLFHKLVLQSNCQKVNMFYSYFLLDSNHCCNSSKG